MIEQQARVISVRENFATIEVGGRSGCPTCDAGKGCGAGVFGRLLNRRPVELYLPNRIDAQQGQAVMVGLPEKLLVQAAARFYLFPLLCGMAGASVFYIVAMQMGTGEGMSDALALTGLLLGLFLAVAGLKKRPMEFPAQSAVHLLRILPAAPETSTTG